jgi:Flp pilus assembly protein TadB
MHKITETHTLPPALDRGRPELAGGTRARWSQFSALLNIENNRGIQNFIYGLLIISVLASVATLVWVAIGPPTLTSLAAIIFITLLFVFTLGGNK